MDYWIKRCAQCGADNHPNDILCAKCKTMLPASKIKSAKEPPRPNMEHIKHDQHAERPGQAIATPQVGQQIIITGIDMPFGQMVKTLTLLFLAAGPAIAIATLFVVIAIDIGKSLASLIP